jgi:arabinan endo-1,5-alpha-L-arabinosidase
VVDKLVDMTRLAGESRTVLRARHDWTLFEANRKMAEYGGRTFNWHTLEGPVVRKHDGRYYCFYSGSNYTTERYGVDYGVAASVTGPYSGAGAERGPRVLRTVAGKVRGPGHHSFVMGPDGKTEYIVYHAWDSQMKVRQMCIDKLAWTREGPRCPGPTWTPQGLSLR